MTQATSQSSDLWVFAYGSLMWKPGFDFVERRRARLDGYHRGFCMWSIHHRGSEENPGLVLALDPKEGASCEGVALRVDVKAADEVLNYLRERELISSAYLERFVSAHLDDGRVVQSVAYVMDQNHVQYTGALSLDRQAEVIARSIGGMGRNDEYLYSTVTQLAEIGCPDSDMEELAKRVRLLNARSA